MTVYKTARAVARGIRVRSLAYPYPPGGGPDGQAPTDGLPFYLNSNLRTWDDTNLVRADGRPRVAAHYFPIFTRSINNAATEASDYYVTGWNTPTGESGIHTAYGGFLRDRHLYREQKTGTTNAWSIEDAQWEIQVAKSRGIDMFVVDILSSTPSHNQNVAMRRLLDAADMEGDFKVVPMLDPSGSTMVGTTAASTIATLVHDFALTAGGSRRESAWFTPNNELVIGSYTASTTPTVAQWNGWFSAITADLGLAGVKMMSTTSGWASTSDTLRQVSFALGDWGSGDDPNLVVARSGTYASAVTGWGLKHFMPVGLQQVRPKNSIYDESVGFNGLLRYLERYAGVPGGAGPIESPEFLQLVTWSDFSEGSVWVPSVMHGWSPLDITAYYLTKFKTGSWPEIKRDAIYMAHRPAPIAAASTYGESSQMAQWSGGGRPTSGLSTPADIVQATVFLSAAATVRINTGGVYTDFSAPAGISTYSRAAVVGAAPSVEVIRNSVTVTSVTSPRAITSAPYVRDGTYVFANNFENLGLRPTSPSRQ